MITESSPRYISEKVTAAEPKASVLVVSDTIAPPVLRPPKCTLCAVKVPTPVTPRVPETAAFPTTSVNVAVKSILSVAPKDKTVALEP